MTAGTGELEEFRDEIDRIDAEVGELIAERVQVAEAVAGAKSDAGLDLVDEDREAVVKSRYEEIFRRHRLGHENGRELADFLIGISLERERGVTSESR